MGIFSRGKNIKQKAPGYGGPRAFDLVLGSDLNPSSFDEVKDAAIHIAKPGLFVFHYEAQVGTRNVAYLHRTRYAFGSDLQEFTTLGMVDPVTFVFATEAIVEAFGDHPERLTVQSVLLFFLRRSAETQEQGDKKDQVLHAWLVFLV